MHLSFNSKGNEFFDCACLEAVLETVEVKGDQCQNVPHTTTTIITTNYSTESVTMHSNTTEHINNCTAHIPITQSFTKMDTKTQLLVTICLSLACIILALVLLHFIYNIVQNKRKVSANDEVYLHGPRFELQSFPNPAYEPSNV